MSDGRKIADISRAAMVILSAMLLFCVLVDVFTSLFLVEAHWKLQDRFSETNGNIPPEEFNALYDSMSRETDLRLALDTLVGIVLFGGALVSGFASHGMRELSVYTSAVAVIVGIHLTSRYLMGVNSMGFFPLGTYLVILSAPLLAAGTRKVTGKRNG